MAQTATDAAAAQLRKVVTAVERGTWVDALVTPWEATEILTSAARALLDALDDAKIDNA